MHSGEQLRRSSEFFAKILNRIPQISKDGSEDAFIKDSIRIADTKFRAYSNSLYRRSDNLIIGPLVFDLMKSLRDYEKEQLADTYFLSQQSGFPLSSIRPAPEGGCVMLMDIELFRYIYSLTKTLSPLLRDPLLVEDLDLRSIRLVRKCAKLAARIGGYFIAVWRVILLNEKIKDDLPSYRILRHPASFDGHLVSLTVANLEQFVIAHEIAHVLLGHIRPKNKLSCYYLGNVIEIVGGDPILGVGRRYEEFRADEMALDLVLRTTKQRRFMNMPEEPPFRMEGALMLFAYLEFLERCASIAGMRSNSDHPSWSERIDNLQKYKSMDLVWRKDIMRFGLPVETRTGFFTLSSIRSVLSDAVAIYGQSRARGST
jgi:hypothetical protein